MKKLIASTIILLCFVSCNYDNNVEVLNERIANLEKQLDECKNGAEKLLLNLKANFDNKQYYEVKNIFNELKNRYISSPQYIEAKSIIDKLEIIEIAQQKADNLKIEQLKNQKLKSVQNLKKDFDDVSGITWYKNKYFTHYNNTNLISLYIGKLNNSVWLRMEMSYTGDDWIFFEKAFLSYDGNTQEIIFNEYNDKKTENNGGNVWEWIDVSINDSQIQFLLDFANSKDPKMRLSGKYTKTRSISSSEKNGIIDIINGYNVLKSN